MSEDAYKNLVTLAGDTSPWERMFTVAPLVLVGSKEEDGCFDLAPKHMVTPVGLFEYFAFVCTPRHKTYHNVQREGVFTVSYPRPSQIVASSLAAAPRCDDSSKPSLEALPTFPATRVDGVFLEDGYLFLECDLLRTIDGFGDYSMMIGTILSAHVAEDAQRDVDRDDADLIHDAPLLAYLHPVRFARIEQSYSFPFPVDFTR